MANTGFTVWFTGPSSSEKETLARMVETEIRKRGLKVELLDEDVIKSNLGKGLDLTKKETAIITRMIGFICHLLSRNAVVAIASAFSPSRGAMQENRKKIGSFCEVYVKSPIDTCIEEDIKTAAKGQIKDPTGAASVFYEEPLAPEVVVEPDRHTKEESVLKIINKLEDLGYLPQKVDRAKEYHPEEEIYSVEDEEKIKKRLEDLGYI